MPGVTVGKQAVEFLCACGLGFLLGAYYEVFRTVRFISPPSVSVCVFQDIFFCVSSALITFFTFLGLADGILYPYLILGEILGFFVFLGSLGNIIHKLLAGIYGFLARILSGVNRRFFSPVFRFFTIKTSKIKAVLEKTCKKLRKTEKKSIFFSKKP